MTADPAAEATSKTEGTGGPRQGGRDIQFHHTHAFVPCQHTPESPLRVGTDPFFAPLSASSHSLALFFFGLLIPSFGCAQFTSDDSHFNSVPPLTFRPIFAARAAFLPYPSFIFHRQIRSSKSATRGSASLVLTWSPLQSLLPPICTCPRRRRRTPNQPSTDREHPVLDTIPLTPFEHRGRNVIAAASRAQ